MNLLNNISIIDRMEIAADVKRGSGLGMLLDADGR